MIVTMAWKSLLAHPVRTAVLGVGFGCGRDDQEALWCWGADARGQLGDESTVERRAPVSVHGLSGVTIKARRLQVIGQAPPDEEPAP